MNELLIRLTESTEVQQVRLTDPTRALRRLTLANETFLNRISLCVDGHFQSQNYPDSYSTWRRLPK